MTRQNYKGDFMVVQTFFHEDDAGGQVQVAVPEHVKLEYFTPQFQGLYVAERDGERMTNCSLAEDGMSLNVAICLSRKSIGIGPMVCIVTEYVQDPDFPDGVRAVRNPVETGILLWKGQNVVADGIYTIPVIQEIVRGKSAYEIAVEYGFTGTEEEWLASLKGKDGETPDLSDIEADIAELMDEVFPLSFRTFIGGGQYEHGQEVTPELSWSLSRKGKEVSPDAATVNGSTDGVSEDKKSYVSDPVQDDADFRVEVSSGTQAVSRTATFRFLYRKWWGVSEKAALTPEDVLSLSGSQLASGRALGAASFDCTGGKYPYYVIPSELADGIECWIGGLRNSDLSITDLDVTNAYGVSYGYKVIRLNELQTGVLTIEFR